MSFLPWYPYTVGFVIGTANGWWRWGRKIRKARVALDAFEASLRERGLL